MSSRTFKVIVLLVGLLFINIEAANAGLVQKITLYIRHEFSNTQLIYFISIFMIVGFLTYVLFTPVSIGKEKRGWLNYYSYSPGGHDYQRKRDVVKKISDILNSKEPADRVTS
jgi:hypothetical protein